MTHRAIAALAVLLLVSASSASTAPATRARYLMGTICEITADAAEVEHAFDEAARIERFLSTWLPDSELSRLNAGQQAAVSPELSALLVRTMDWNERTGNAFNPLIAPLVGAWRTRQSGALPDDAAIRHALARMQRSNVLIDGSRIVLRNGAAFEEGAFGKGYALDRMLSKLSSREAVLNFGGQLLVRGSIPVTIADPERRDRPAVSFLLRDASLSTSSGSEKTFSVSGRQFSHIIDPRDGRALPPRGSASVICDDAFTADVLSTAMYVMGADAGLRWACEHSVAALFITPDGAVRPSRLFRERAQELRVAGPDFKLKD